MQKPIPGTKMISLPYRRAMTSALSRSESGVPRRRWAFASASRRALNSASVGGLGLSGDFGSSDILVHLINRDVKCHCPAMHRRVPGEKAADGVGVAALLP